ncbi:MAG: hypothetical protein K0R83_3012, partial [Caulobacter sp.]|nr:hypothetical protein [Caulobacter sp.]
ADTSEQPVPPAVTSFLEGLAGEADGVQALMPGDPRLALPRGALRRIRCAMCGHTFRAHDLVVVCPCRPDSQLCATTIHQDPGRSLACYDAWLASPLSNYCLTTSREMR